MSFRNLILAIVSKKTATSMEEESRRWIATCRHCGQETSIWDLGGIRYGASGKSSTRIRCRGCDEVGWQTFVKRDLG
jgi:hypothetical protein